MSIIVKDANVLMDMVEANLHDLWFSLGIPTHTTDLVLAEVMKVNQRAHISPFVSSRKLQIHKLKATDLEKAAMWADKHRVSIADASAFLLSERLGAVLLTGDGRLRKLTTPLSVEVRGVLWVFDHLIEKHLLSEKDAAHRLKHLMQQGSFLPVEACIERIHRWERS